MTAAPHTTEQATARLEALWGHEALSRTQAATVIVFGAGGVGSSCIEALARGGVGTLIVIDGDEVAPSDLNRQAIAFFDTVGQRKVNAVRAFIHRINPDARVITHDTFVPPDAVEELIDECRAEAGGGSIDYLIDAIDTVSTKLEIACVAEKRHIPHVSSMGGGMKVQPELLRFADIYETSGDALARAMRKGCRKRGVERLEVLYSPERPLPRPEPVDDEPPSLGTTSYLPPIMGQMLAGYVLRRLAGFDGRDAEVGRDPGHTEDSGGEPC